jgi:competence protein ComEC
MTLVALAFAAGAALLQLQPDLPSPAWAWALLPLALLALRFHRVAWMLALAAGFAWAALLAHPRMAERLAPELEGRDLEIVGVVAGLPAVGERSVRFELDFEAATGGERLPRRILLSWYRTAPDEDQAALIAAPLHPGERWMFTVRLRRPHGNVNPNGFDYEAWLLERGIGATGYVRQRGEQRLLGYRRHLLDVVELAREAIRDRFLRTLGATPAAGILAALAVGDQRSIPAEEWRLFNRTGVTHLMSISGLHVTLVSGFIAWLAGFAWRRVPGLVLRVPARKVAALAAILAAFVYTLLAGFALPAQRTCYMVTVVALALWSGRIASPSRTLALALAVVVAIDPWAPLSAGLWLSFGAVALIFHVAIGWSAPEPRMAQWVRVQWAITLGLAPAALLLFGQVSVAGPLANAVAIPLVSGVVTPLALLAALLPLEFLLHAAGWLVEGLLQFLEWCAALPGALWRQHVPALWTVLLGLGGVAWMVAPRGVPWRGCGLALMAPAFALPPPQPASGEAWITTLDVGQGLAVVVRTAGRTLLYDAGPAYGADADSGSRVVVPALFGAGIPRLDTFVVSHEDSDHLGGALSVLESLEVGALVSSLPGAHPLNGLAAARSRCVAGMRWEWDGVRFAMLHPAPGDAPARRNDLSCVLKVEAGGRAVLLTGDIERASESNLLRKRQDLRADVLLVPHHGSRTSSTAEFIEAVAPRVAVVPAGYRNRFNHPNREVLERYRAAGAEIVRTDLQGAVTVKLASRGMEVLTERQRRGRYWLQ